MLELKYFVLKFIIPLKIERFFSIEKVRHLKFNTGKLPVIVINSNISFAENWREHL